MGDTRAKPDAASIGGIERAATTAGITDAATTAISVGSGTTLATPHDPAGATGI